jgi:hypothetical protein
LLLRKIDNTFDPNSTFKCKNISGIYLSRLQKEGAERGEGKGGEEGAGEAEGRKGQDRS